MTSGTPTELGRITALGALPAMDLVSGLRAVVLLAGTIRPSDLSRSIGRSLLDLPVGNGASVLSLWQEEVATLARTMGAESISVRVLVSRSGHHPQTQRHIAGAPVQIEQDQSEYRGTGGVLRDLARGYDASDLLLVANGAQVLTEPLPVLARLLLKCDADVSLFAYDDGTPSGLFAIRCGSLGSIRDGGFVDFKEQALPRLAAAGRSIRVVRCPRASAIPVRTVDGYISGVRAHQRLRLGRPVAHDPFDEDWSPMFSLVEDMSTVAPGAAVHDSVVLSGGTVRSGAVIVRSVVCPGGVVSAGSTVADQIVAAQHRDRRARRG